MRRCFYTRQQIPKIRFIYNNKIVCTSDKFNIIAQDTQNYTLQKFPHIALWGARFGLLVAAVEGLVDLAFGVVEGTFAFVVLGVNIFFSVVLFGVATVVLAAILLVCFRS